MLLDADIREETVALPIGTVAYMLSRFAVSRPAHYKMGLSVPSCGFCYGCGGRG
jgi:hypothetical protein